MQSSDLLIILIAIHFPPAAAAMVSGLCSCDVLINVLLTVLGVIPGHIHAFWLIWKRSKAEEAYGKHNYTYLGNGEYRSNASGTASVAPFAAGPNHPPGGQPTPGDLRTQHEFEGAGPVVGGQGIAPGPVENKKTI